ncbi:MAG: hypothetical protein ACRC62_18925 [Microcoleus sp.]
MTFSAELFCRRRKAQHGFGHGYTDELLNLHHSQEGRGKREEGRRRKKEERRKFSYL